MKSKKKVILLGIGIVAVIILGLIVFSLTRDKTNYLTLTNNLLAQSKGSFRYVFDIRTSEHEEGGTSDSASSLASLENIEANMDVDKILEEYQKNKKDFVEWTDKDGVEVVAWDYPKYKLIVEGNVKSVEPLEMSLSLNLATNYFNDTLTDIVVKDNKTYVNIEQLRYWLINSKDKNLITLGNTLPESAKYVEYEGDAFNLYSTFAEVDEIDKSRELSIVSLYNRFLVAEKVLVSKLDIDKKCLTNENEVYSLNITGDASVDLLKSIKSLVLRIGDTYKSIISNQYSNKLMSDEQYEQAKKETDNIVSAFSNLGMFFNTANLSDMNLQVGGNARTYTSGKGSTVFESTLATQFTANDTDYSISIQLHKDSKFTDVELPKQSSASISTYTDTDFVEKYLLEVFKYLNITGVDLEKQLISTCSSIKSDMLKDFVNLVNNENKGKEGFTSINQGNVLDFIFNYKDMEVTDDTSELDAVNIGLVKDFMEEFKDFIPNIIKDQDTNSSIKDGSRYTSLIADTDKFRIYADFNIETSNTRCIILDTYILNTSSEELVINTNDISLRTLQSSKYPANYLASLLEYDNSFDKTKAPETVTIAAGGFVKVPLYFIVQNGIEYMDLWYGETNLGVVIAR